MGRTIDSKGQALGEFAGQLTGPAVSVTVLTFTSADLDLAALVLPPLHGRTVGGSRPSAARQP